MFSKYLLPACILLTLFHHEIRGQEIIRLDSGKLPVVCFAGKTGWSSRIAPPESFLRKGPSNGRTKSASIHVEYFGFTEEAKQAFEYATSIWESFLTSPVEIRVRSEEHTSELQSRENLVCRLLLEKKK